MDKYDSLTRMDVAVIIGRFVLIGAISYASLKWMMDIMDPTNKRKKEAQKKAQTLFERLNLTNLHTHLSEYELVVASQLIDPNSIGITWNNIGGLEHIIDDIKSEVILPMRLPHVSNNHKPPTGVLLYGPPGCGKTMLAKATAREAGARFISLDVALLTDKWYGESQKLVRAVFTLARKIQPCIIFIDEIDSFLRSRNTQDHEATAMIKAQFMTLWDGIETESDSRVVIMGATNRPEDVDPAIARRMPAMYSIGLPNTTQRRHILESMIDKYSLDDRVDYNVIADLTEDFSGSDLKEMYRVADMFRLKEYAALHRDMSPSEEANILQNLRPIRMDDFINAIQKVSSSSTRINVTNLSHSNMR